MMLSSKFSRLTLVSEGPQNYEFMYDDGDTDDGDFGRWPKSRVEEASCKCRECIFVAAVWLTTLFMKADLAMHHKNTSVYH